MSTAATPIKFVVGSRKLFAVDRRLLTVGLSLEQLLSGAAPSLPPLAEDHDGYRLLSVPAAALPQLRAQSPGFAMGGLQLYDRRYIAMDGSFEDYLGQFSGKTRSTLKRKGRKLAELANGTLEIAEFHRPDTIEQFFAEALPLSNQTYQARLLDAGLPGDAAFIAGSRDLAAQDRLRAYLLRIEGKAAAYLYLPVEGETLVYAYLGYDPVWAQASVGTVLQLEALERLFAESRYRYFDFTEGDGAHKTMFSTGAAPAASLFLLRPGLGNQALMRGLALFDGGVAGAKAMADRIGLTAAARKALRG